MPKFGNASFGNASEEMPSEEMPSEEMRFPARLYNSDIEAWRSLEWVEGLESAGWDVLDRGKTTVR